MKKGLLLVAVSFLLIPVIAITGVEAISEKEKTVLFQKIVLILLVMV